MAEGAPAETFIDNVQRQRFDNYAEFEALYGAEPEPMQDCRSHGRCSRQVPPAIRAKISQRAADVSQRLAGSRLDRLGGRAVEPLYRPVFGVSCYPCRYPAEHGLAETPAFLGGHVGRGPPLPNQEC